MKIRRNIVVGLLILLASSSAAAGKFGFGFSIASWGPFEIGISLPGAALLGAGQLLGNISFFSESRQGHFEARFEPEPLRYQTELETFQINSSDVIPARVLRIKFRRLFDLDGDLALGQHGAKLELKDDGRLVFKGTPFRGYLFVHYDKAISIFDQDDRLVMVAFLRASGSVSILLRKEEQVEKIVEFLFGAKVSN